MNAPIHDRELDTSESMVRSLLAGQCPQWPVSALTVLLSSGTSNTVWRLQSTGRPDLLVRLPRTPGAAAGIAGELELLPRLAESDLRCLTRTPRLAHHGRPSEEFPHPWAVLDWIEGRDAWSARRELASGGRQLALQLAETVRTIASLPLQDVAPTRRPGERGGPVDAVVERLERWLSDETMSAATMIDVAAVRRLAARCREAGWESGGEPGPESGWDSGGESGRESLTSVFVHGDLIPGNLLLNEESGELRLSAIIDWGAAGWADPAQDLAPAWSLFDQPDRDAFREAVMADEACWLRAAAFELEHAVGGVLYYRPRRHQLADIMARTLQRLLDDADLNPGTVH